MHRTRSTAPHGNPPQATSCPAERPRAGKSCVERPHGRLLLALLATAALLLLLFSHTVANAQALLTDEEKAWLAANPHKLKLSFDRNFPPLEFLGPDGHFNGLAAEILKLIEERLGAEIIASPATDWPSQLRMLENGEMPVVPVIVHTEERERFAQFTPPYIEIPTVIIGRRNEEGGKVLSDFAGRRVAVVRGYVTEHYVRERSLDAGIEVVPVSNVQAGLRDVSFGVVDAVVENLAVAAHYIDKEQLPNLKVVGSTELNYSLSFAVSNKYPLLYSALLKAYAAIPPEELERVKAHWIRLDTGGLLSPEQRRVLRMTAVAGGAVVGMLSCVAWLLRRRLRKEMKELEQARNKVQEQGARLALVLDATRTGIWEYEPATGATYLSPEWHTMLGRLPGTIPATYAGWTSLIHPDDAEATTRQLDAYVHSGGRGVYEAEFRLLDASGEWRWVLAKGRTVRRDSLGRPERVIGMNTDIHTMRQHRDAALESERKFRTIFENAPYAIVVNRMSDGAYLDVNRAFLRSQKKSREEMLATAPGHYSDVSPEQAEALRNKIRLLGGMHNLEGRSIHPDGTVRHIIYSSVPITYDGETAILSITVDVTDRKQAENALKASEEQYRAIFNNAPVGIFRTSFDGHVIDGNPALARMLGYADRSELLRNLKDKAVDVYPEPEARRSLLDALLRNPSGVRMEFELQRRDRSPFHAIVNATLQFDADNQPFILDGIVEDISVRKQAEEQLRQSEQKFFQLFQLCPDAIVVARSEDGIVRDVNQAFIRMFGFPREEVLGTPLRALGLLAPETSLDAPLALLRQHGELGSHEFAARHKDGTPMACLLSCQMLRIDGEEHMMAVLRDITQSKKMQEVIIQTEKMVSLGGIAAGIAHEINNPLGIVLQASQNLTQRTRPDFPKNVEVAKAIGLDMELLASYMRQRKLDVFLADIQSAALRASAIIRHMLEFSRRSESRRKVCDLVGLLGRALALTQNDYDLKKSYDFKKIEVSLNIADDLPVINCTETEIEQVVINLLRNSAQAMASAKPPVAAPRIDLDLGATPGGIRLVIADNGPGMPPEVQRRAFEPFFTTKPPGIGTGLGLSVSYFIVTKGHGGRMHVESTPGKGTRFTIDLPVDIPPEATA